MNCEPYSSFSSLSSDHCVITAKIRLSLRSNKPKTTTSSRYNWTKLRDQNRSNEFKITLSNRYQSLQDENNDNTTNTSFRCAHAAEECIPTRQKTKQKVP